MEPRLKKVMLQ